MHLTNFLGTTFYDLSLTWRPLDHDHLGVVGEALGGAVNQGVPVVEAQLLVGPRLHAGLQVAGRFAVNVGFGNLEKF